MESKDNGVQGRVLVYEVKKYGLLNVKDFVEYNKIYIQSVVDSTQFVKFVHCTVVMCTEQNWFDLLTRNVHSCQTFTRVSPRRKLSYSALKV